MDEEKNLMLKCIIKCPDFADDVLKSGSYNDFLYLLKEKNLTRFNRFSKSKNIPRTPLEVGHPTAANFDGRRPTLTDGGQL